MTPSLPDFLSHKRRSRRQRCACSPSMPCPEHRLEELKAQARATEQRCLGCGCTTSGPRCTVTLPNDLGHGACVPAGTFDNDRCSACEMAMETA